MPIQLGSYFGNTQSTEEREFQKILRLPDTTFSLHDNTRARRTCKLIDKLQKMQSRTSNENLRVQIEQRIVHIRDIIYPKLNGPDLVGGAPLHGAAYAGDCKTLQKLIALGADLEKIDSLRGFSVLHIAIQKGSLDCVREIMKHAPHLADRPDKQGITPIDYAVALNRPDIGRVLKGKFQTVA